MSRFVAEEKVTVTVDGNDVVLDIWDTAGRCLWVCVCVSGLVGFVGVAVCAVCYSIEP